MLTVTDSGHGNVVEISDEAREQLNGRLQLTGSDVVVRIGEGCSSGEQFDVVLGERSSLVVGDRVNLGHLFVYTAADADVRIGTDTGFNGIVRLLLHEPGSITIGHACLFAGGVDISVSDMHSIVEVASGLRINPPENVTIGDHVWVGQGCQVLRGTTIGNGAVVGAASVARGRLASYTVNAGVPARKIRDGATWDFRLLPYDRTYVPLDRREGMHWHPRLGARATIRLRIADALRALLGR